MVDKVDDMVAQNVWSTKKMADMVDDMEVDMVSDMVANKKERKNVSDMALDMVADMKVNNVTERVGHMGWLIGPNFFRPEAYPACASSKLRE